MAAKLLQRGTHEVQDEFEAALLQAYSTCQSQLNNASSAAPAQRGPLTQALLYAILTQQQNAASFMNQLTTISTDGYASFVAALHRLINDSYQKLLEQPRIQLIWLLQQLIPLHASDVDNLCILLLRQIIGGDLSPGNIWLAGQLLDVLNSNLDWMAGNEAVLTSAVYTYLRLLPDHSSVKNSPAVAELRQSEIKFCTTMLRDCFQECLSIGRDLVRLLQDVACIPEFEPVWRDLLSNPAAFKAPGFTDISQLYVTRTPTRYLQSRLTPVMESQIKYMLTHVRMGNQRRFQSWFTQKFLSAPESETLVCDLLRYICCAHHPSNQILQSDILPRWALVGWLLKCCKSNHVEANAKLALLYDWLFFVPKNDNIMNIEPAILVMVHSIPKYADMTNSLLEFLFLLIENYDPARKDLIQRGVAASIDILVGKGVVRSLEPLSGSTSVAPWLRDKLVQNFPSYCRTDAASKLKQDALQAAANKAGIQDDTPEEPGLRTPPAAADNGDSNQHEPVLNDVNNIRKRRRTTPAHDAVPHELDKLSKALAVSQDAAIKVLEGSLALFTGDERAQKFAIQVSEVLKGGGYEMFSPLLSTPSSKPEGDETMSITSSLFRLYVGSCFPQLKTMLLSWQTEGFSVGARLLCYVSRLSEELEECSMSQQVRNPPKADGEKTEAGSSQSEVSEEGEVPEKPKRKRLQAVDNRTGRSLHQAFHAAVADGFKAYEEFLKASVQAQDSSGSGSGSSSSSCSVEEVKAALLGDLRTCLVWNITRLQRVLPPVFRYLPSLASGNEKLVHLAVSVLAPEGILGMELKLASGELSIAGKRENLAGLLKNSTSWDAFEQQYFWKLLAAEVQGRGLLTCVEVVKAGACSGCLNPEADVEAMSGLLQLARSSGPSNQLVSLLLGVPPGFGKIVVGVFASWIFCCYQQLVSCLNHVSKDATRGGTAAARVPVVDALLNHLEELEMNQSLEEQRRATLRRVLLKLSWWEESCDV